MAFPSQASRLNKIPKYLFAELDKLKIEFETKTKQKIIDLGEGNPAFTPHQKIITELKRALKSSTNHRYPSYQGKIEMRIAIAKWYKKRFNVELNPETEVAVLIGSKEGIAHFIWAMIDKDDIAYVPSPSYPVYHNQILLSGGISKFLPLFEQNDFLPSLSDIKPHKKLKLLCLNYPNNPTSAIAPYSFYQEIIKLAYKYGFYCCNDNVYSELYYQNPPHSILEIPGAKECCIEFHSLSKSFSMCGWRIGFAVGNHKLIKALINMKQNVDSGPFGAIQDASIFALNNYEQFVKKIRLEYKKRLTILVKGLQKLGWNCKMPPATFYLWCTIPFTEFKANSLQFSYEILRKTGILITPGIGFGKHGEGYVRFAVIETVDKIKQVIERLSAIL